MAKVQIKSEKLTPYGGIFSIMEKYDSMLSPVIDSTLGQRSSSIMRRAMRNKGSDDGQLTTDAKPSAIN